MIAAVFLAALADGACKEKAKEAKPPAAEKPANATITHHTLATELFVEFPPLVVGAESVFAVHLTRLADWKAIDKGRVVVTLDGGGAAAEEFTVAAPDVPGIFRPFAKPANAGKRRLRIRLEGGAAPDVHDVGEVTVHESAQAAKVATPPEAPAGASSISFLKEQQWQIDFMVAPVVDRELRPTIAVNGVLRASPGGDSRILAPAAGRLVAASGRFPHVGITLRRGQLIARIAPVASGSPDLASLELAVKKAALDLEDAKRTRARLEALFASEAVPEKRVIEARHEEEVSVARLRTAEKRLAQTRATQDVNARGAAELIAVRAPATGRIARASVVAGASVERGQELFHLLSAAQPWVEARVPEAELASVRGVESAEVEAAGFPKRFGASAPPERGLGFSGVIDPATRTASLLFSLDEPDAALPLGLFVRVFLATGPARRALAVPHAALVQQDGRDIVFVQTGGESFERRPVELGLAEGEHVEVRAGLKAGERVVTRGAYFVRLASASGQAPAHGHAH